MEINKIHIPLMKHDGLKGDTFPPLHNLPLFFQVVVAVDISSM
ncbi:hypothetical protein [Xenorhabdus bovienii]|nr:hypothetical protein [Xenorhabdus bovienii]